MIKARSAECRLPRSATGDDQIRAMRAAAWHTQGVVSATTDPPEPKLDDWERAFLKQVGKKLFGERKQSHD